MTAILHGRSSRPPVPKRIFEMWPIASLLGTWLRFVSSLALLPAILCIVVMRIECSLAEEVR